MAAVKATQVSGCRTEAGRLACGRRAGAAWAPPPPPRRARLTAATPPKLPPHPPPAQAALADLEHALAPYLKGGLEAVDAQAGEGGWARPQGLAPAAQRQAVGGGGCSRGRGAPRADPTPRRTPPRLHPKPPTPFSRPTPPCGPRRATPSRLLPQRWRARPRRRPAASPPAQWPGSWGPWTGTPGRCGSLWRAGGRRGRVVTIATAATAVPVAGPASTDPPRAAGRSPPPARPGQGSAPGEGD